jgi:hypothetical protein
LYYVDKSPKILGHQWLDKATASHFDVTMKPLTAEEYKDDAAVHGGMMISVTVKPGLPQGPIQQNLSIETDVSSQKTIELPIHGVVGSDITVFGHDWSAETNTLYLNEVASRSGTQRKLSLVVRGPLRKQMKFKPAHAEPDVLKVSIGEPKEINHGAAIQWPLTISILPGSPTMNYLGEGQGKFGEIILETTHPQVPQLHLRVRFAIED